MNDGDRQFWLVIIGAVLVKLVLSPTADWKTDFGRAALRAFMTGIPAIWMAYTFTDPLLSWLQWDATQYRNMMAGLLALAGENLIRRFLKFTSSDESILKALQWWFGGKGGPRE